MRILHVVTWTGPGNPFGGPVRVAINDAEELRRRGHQVEVLAAQPPRRQRGSWRSADHDIRGFDARHVLPGAGFSGILAPGMLAWAWRNGRSFDVIHVHLARDLVTLPFAAIARRLGVPYVVQCHGMIDPSTRRSARVLDVLLTNRVLAGAGAVFVLTEHEQAAVRKAVPHGEMTFEVLPNGVPLPAPDEHPHTGPPELLFCARLHRRKRPVLFADMAVHLLASQRSARFSMIGADEGERHAVEQVLAASPYGRQVRLDGPVEPERVALRLTAADALVLPSVDEPFPMVVLESLAAGRPVVVTSSCGLADFVRRNDCGIVVADDNLGELIAAAAAMIDEPDRREAMGTAGRRAVERELGMSRVGEQLEHRYSEIVWAGWGTRGSHR